VSAPRPETFGYEPSLGVFRGPGDIERALLIGGDVSGDVDIIDVVLRLGLLDVLFVSLEVVLLVELGVDRQKRQDGQDDVGSV
jgi:hypothetical protein